ncbi:MAG TPA: helix-turn-helix transcriptional regulator [Syntrophomonadaceae bacterium]|nr:helix-turn-helix transcriptional regulator [Syntrophomonadaceae bacterium]
MPNRRAIGQRLRKERRMLGLSRLELAELVELSDYYIGQLERGERQMSLNVLVNISSCLHVTLDYLVLGKNPCNQAYIQERSATYNTKEDDKDKELKKIISRCSIEEKELFIKLIKTTLPYLERK